MAQKSGHGLSWITRTAHWVGRKAAGVAVTLLPKDEKIWRSMFGGGTYAGKTVNDDTALAASAVWSCVKILAECIGSLPLAVYERDKKTGNATKVDHPLAAILTATPNADMTDVEFIEAGQVNLGLRGNAYSYIERSAGGDVISLYPIAAHRVEPRRDERGEIVYRVNEDGRWESVPREKIWHIRGFGNTGLVGYSPIGVMRQAIGMSLGAEEFQARFFGSGARPSAVASIPAWLKDDQRKIARENLQATLGGLENAHKIHLLEGGMKLEPWGLPLEDLQFVELRRFQIAEICRIYRIPPHMVADMERATFSNIEQMSLEFVMYTLLPWLTRWEAATNRWLLKPGERERFFVRFNFEGLLRADSAARAQLYATLLQNGVKTRNEIRALENDNRSEDDGMDDFTVQSNMVAIDKLAALTAANLNKPQPAPASPGGKP